MALDWAAVDPLVRGPMPSHDGARRLFAVPPRPGAGFVRGRLVPGRAWPGTLPPLDRPAAVPVLAPLGVDADAADVVLAFDVPGERRAPVCVADAADRVRWACDPGAWIQGVLDQAYVTDWRRPLPSRVPWVDYSILPNAVKGVLQRLQDPRAAMRSNAFPFPRLPLDDFVDALRRLCATLACGRPPAVTGLWPGGRQAAVTVTHDVDTAWVLEPRRRAVLEEMLATETTLGFRGAWFVTGRTLSPTRHAAALASLARAGHEVGPHGWRHDARLNYLSATRQEQAMAKARARFQVCGGLTPPGIRTPWYCSSPQLFGVLARHFAYDSSVVNASALFTRGTNSGCATVFPYRALELPLTLPVDTVLDPDDGAAVLLALAGTIVAQGGVVVLTFHPQPHQSANPRGLRLHRRLLEGLRALHGDTLWSATPAEIVRQYRAIAGQM